MDSLSPQVVSAAKLPILNPNKFDLWKMRIEQYFMMTDYSLWKVILNGGSLVPTRVVEAIKKGFGGNTETKKVQKTLLKQQYENFTSSSSESLDQIHDKLQKLVSQLEIHRVSLSQEDVNLSVFAICAKMPVSSLPNVDSLSNAARRFLQKTGKNLGPNGPTSMGFDMSKVECYNCHKKGHFARKCRSPKDSRRTGVAEPQRRTVPVETSTSNALVSQCDGVGSYDWSYQAEEEPANYALMAFSSSSSSSDNEVPSCSKACSKSYTQFHTQYDKLTADFCKSQFDVISYQIESDFESWHPGSLYDRCQPSGGYHAAPPPYTRIFMPPKPDLVFNTSLIAVETDHSAFNVQLSPPKPDQDLSHITRPTTHIIDFWVSDSKDESETKALHIVPHFVQSSEQVKSSRHSVQPVETTNPAATYTPASQKSTSSGKRRNRKACFVCKSVDHLIKDYDCHAKKMAQPTPRNYAHRGNHKQYAPLTHTNPQKHMVSTVVLTQSRPVFHTAVRPVSAAMPKINVTRPRFAHLIVTKSKSPIRRHITYNPSPKTSNSPPRVTAVQAPVVSATQGNMSHLSDFEELNGGYVAFGGNPKGGKISSKGKIKTGKLDFDDVYFVKELKFNIFSVSQMCDKKNSVLFTNNECLVLYPDFKLPDESQVLLRVPRENNMYNVNLKNIIPSRDLTYLFAKATIDESNLWHRRLGHINFKTINKLVKGNLVRGLPTNVFENDNTYVACKKGKQHRASCNTKPKDETSPILKTFITGLENQLSLKVKVIRSDNETEFKNNDLYQLCGIKGIKKEFSVPRTPQQNGIAERKNKTLIEDARTMLADLLLTIPFWAESSGSINPQNNDRDAAFNGKEHDFDAKKPESEVNVSPSSSAQSRKQDDKTKKEAKGKSHVESFTGYKDLSAEFEDYTDNSSNEVNAAGTIVPTVGQNSLNSTNTFSAAGPLNAASSPTYGKSLFIDASQLLGDLDMPELEDITYFDDEDAVGAEAVFNNLETSIIVSPIPTTRVHKDHPVSQIIGDMSLTTQTRSMIRVVKDQGGLSQMFDNDFHTCMFACFLLQEEPKRVHQALKDLSWIEAMQEELLQFKMQKV
uniref:Uncharacterized protein n=1 Tax=Tanacetum cinerariifolium TaxID=118510 RepID=A0A6L2KCC7_TANCI|nr:hypothetical protein [Tanacetum cinerariifolium]